MTSYEDLLLLAKDASKNSYSPYSNFSVGAAVLYESGNVYTGCNIENVSYGLSLCAERSAMAAAINSSEKTYIKAIAIYSPKQKKCMPCGACRQWLQEFEKGQQIEIILEDDNTFSSYKIDELLPYSFKLI